jgi:hypothetical protein
MRAERKQAEQAAEKKTYSVILSEAKNLSSLSKREKTKRDSSLRSE